MVLDFFHHYTRVFALRPAQISSWVVQGQAKKSVGIHDHLIALNPCIELQNINLKSIFMSFRTLILLLVVAMGLAASSSVSWTTSVNLKAGSRMLVTSLTSTATSSYATTFASAIVPNPNFAVSLKCATGIIDFEVSSATSYYLGFSVFISSISVSGFTYTLNLLNNTIITSWRSTYLCFDVTTYTFITTASSVSTYTAASILVSGTGYRQIRSSAVVAYDPTRTIFYMPFLTQAMVQRPTLTENFIARVSMEIVYTSGKYYYVKVHATDGGCKLYSMNQTRVTFDQTAVQSTKITFFDVKFFIGSNGVPSPYSLVFSDPSNFFCGINHFNFAGTIAPQFRFDPVQFTLTSTGYTFINISTINYRIRGCASPTIYFLESENLCYDVCPSAYYPETTNLYCIPCYPGCLVCIEGSSTSCSQCNTTANRILSGSSCPCVTTFYDSGVIQCQLCTVGCYSCSNTSTNCSACTSNSFRTLTGNSCPCDPGYADTVGSEVCVTCSSVIPTIIPGCIECTYTSSCTRCNSTLNRILSGSVCSCVVGYSESASLCVQCGTLINGCSLCSSSSTCTQCNAGLNMQISGTTCVCVSGYALSHSACVTCGSVLTGCTACSDLATCTDCDDTQLMTLSGGTCSCIAGYVLVSGICNTCNSTLVGCTACSSPTVCTACDSNLHMIVSADKCVCDTGYVNSSEVCVLCSAFIQGCTACSSTSVCTDCDAQLNVVLNGSTCSCTSGYALSSGNCATCSSMITGCSVCSSASVCTSCDSGRTVQSGMCPLCSVFINGCTECSSQSVCTRCDPLTFMHPAGGICSCDAGYTLDPNVCVTCSSLLANCLLCSSSTNCTSCSDGYYVNAALSCQLCSSSISGCLSCPSSSICTTCDTDNHFKVSASNKCDCQDGFYFNSTTKTCDQCSGILQNCLKCSSATVCDQCVTPLTFVGGRCQCASTSQYYNLTATNCVNCDASCKSCLNSTNCLTCDSSLFRMLSGQHCVCKFNYAQNAQKICVALSSCIAGFNFNGTVCVEICGDGLLFELECDDGNLEAGDGCSPTCTIESNFTCRDGSTTTPSKCSYNKPLTMTLTSTTKDLFANAISFTIKVQPELKVLEAFNFSQIVSSNLPTSAITATYTSGYLMVRIVYVQSIQDSPASFYIAPPITLDNTFDMKGSSASFVVSPENAQAYYYPEETYGSASSMQLILKICMGMALGTFLLGIGLWKLIGVEVMHIMQILFLVNIFVEELPPTLAPCSELIPTLGYNKLFSDFPGLYDFGSPKLSKTLTQMQLKARFVENCNYMIAVQVVVLFFGLCLFLLSRMINKYREPLLAAAKYAMNQILMAVILFNCLTVSFSLGLHILYWSRPQAQPVVAHIINLASAVAVLAIALVHFWLMSRQNDYFDHNNQSLKHDRLSKLHPMVLFLCRFVIGFTMSMLSEFKYGIFVPAGLQLIYLFYIIAKRPYRKTVVTIRAIVNESLIVLIFAIVVVYSLGAMSAQSLSSSPWSKYMGAPVWVQTALIIVAALFSLACELYALYKAICKKKNIDQVIPETFKESKIDNESSAKVNHGQLQIEDLTNIMNSKDVTGDSVFPRESPPRERKIKKTRFMRKDNMEELVNDRERRIDFDIEP